METFNPGNRIWIRQNWGCYIGRREWPKEGGDWESARTDVWRQHLRKEERQGTLGTLLCGRHWKGLKLFDQWQSAITTSGYKIPTSSYLILYHPSDLKAAWVKDLNATKIGHPQGLSEVAKTSPHMAAWTGQASANHSGCLVAAESVVNPFETLQVMVIFEYFRCTWK